MKNLYFACTEIKDGFWKFYSELVRNVTVHSVYERFRETGRFDAFRCGWREGQPNKPHIFWDSDVAKWIEGAAFLIEKKRDEELEEIIDHTAGLIEKNQREDGYFNSYFLTLEPSAIFSRRSDHELYCTGHLIEAAIAYHTATGKDRLLKCMLKNVDCIYRIFVEEQSAGFVTPGHEEIELALLKLYEHTKDQKHLALARFFINSRGNNEKEKNSRSVYAQDNIPVREIREAGGHAVRAGYLYTAMAMLAGIDGDAGLKAACSRVFSDIVNSKMSITGGVGSEYTEEAFSYQYDLPNTSVYNETCAAISLALFAGEMQQLEANALYGDTIERIYYNGFLSGVSLSGDKFFYTNPLEIDQKKYNRKGGFQPPSERVKVFQCSCCPPNVVRMLASLPRYMYTIDEDTVYCSQFASAETRLTIGGRKARLIQKTHYPADGKIEFQYYGEPMTLYVRIPGWCTEYKGETENGFVRFRLTNGESAVVDLPMKLHFIEANPNAQDSSGRFAVMRGPLVYCMEGIDNGENLRDITLLESGRIEIREEEGLPAPVIYIDAERREKTAELYRLKSSSRIKFTARLIPYFSICNRGAADLLVWTMVK